MLKPFSAFSPGGGAMRRKSFRSGAVLLTVLSVDAGAAGTATRAPEFTHRESTEWINSAPLKLSSLRGSLVLIEFWAFDCVNCRRTLPWVESIHAKYGARGLKIVSVHTPELKQEYVPANVRRVVKELGIGYPVMLDSNYSYWNAINNQYWPAFYLVNRKGRIVRTALGELHRGQPRGDQLEAAIREELEQALGRDAQ